MKTIKRIFDIEAGNERKSQEINNGNMNILPPLRLICQTPGTRMTPWISITSIPLHDPTSLVRLQTIPLSFSTNDDLLFFKTLFTLPPTTTTDEIRGSAAVYASTMSLPLASTPLSTLPTVVPNVLALTYTLALNIAKLNLAASVTHLFCNSLRHVCRSFSG